MTDPPESQGPWARPAQQPPALDQPTQQIPHGGHAPDPATKRLPAQGVEPPQPPPTAMAPPAPTQAAQPPPPPPPAYGLPPAEPVGPGEPDADAAPPGNRFQRLLRDPMSIVLVVVIVLALSAAGLIGGELYARHRGNQLVSDATKCVVKDDASASFGGATPFLWQFATSHYSNLSIDTAGNQILDIKGMKAQIAIDDIRLQDSGDSKGTIGKLNATITWSADGIKQTVQNKVGELGATIQTALSSYLAQIPFLGGLIAGSADFIGKSISIKDVKTDKSAGTVIVDYSMAGGLASGTVTVTPTVENQALSLKVGAVTVGDQPVPRELLQDPLSLFTQSLTNGLPLGIKASGVQVTDTGVIAQFGTQNASIPSGAQNECFKDL